MTKAVLPPNLTGVGNKLTTEALHGVLMEGDRLRPYMSIRMPEYGDAVTGLASHFTRADAIEGDEVEPPFSIEAARVGHQLTGDTGFKCIECHSFNGHARMGEPGPDLADVHRRIRPGWLSDAVAGSAVHQSRDTHACISCFRSCRVPRRTGR